jgi:hypothetical protein
MPSPSIKNDKQYELLRDKAAGRNGAKATASKKR